MQGGTPQGTANRTYASLAVDWQGLASAGRYDRAIHSVSSHDAEDLAALTVAFLHRGGDRGASRHTERAYAISVRMFVAAFRDRDLLSISAQDARTWLRALGASGAWRQDGTIGPASRATVRVRAAGARALYDALAWVGVSTENPFLNARQPGPAGPPLSARDPYSLDELSRLIGGATPAERVAMLLAVDCDFRAETITNLDWRDADLDVHRTLSAQVAGKTVIVPIGARLLRALRDLHGDAANGPIVAWTDSGLRKRLRVLCARMGVHYRGFAALRRGRTPQRLHVGGAQSLLFARDSQDS